MRHPAPHARTAFRRLAAAALLSLGGAHSAQAQTASTPPTSAASDSLLRAARVVIAGAQYAAFVTVDSTGQPQARTVQPVAPDSNMVVWFATNPRTRKVGEIARDPRVALHYFEAGSLAYVTLVGRARVVRDRAEKDAHWNPAWSQYYPDRDTSVVLIEVTPERVEIVDIRRDVDGDKSSWRPPSVTLPRRTPAARKPPR